MYYKIWRDENIKKNSLNKAEVWKQMNMPFWTVPRCHEGWSGIWTTTASPIQSGWSSIQAAGAPAGTVPVSPRLC